MSTWTTQDGQVLEIKWMQSRHLVHSFNMLVRKHQLSVSDIAQLCSRDESSPLLPMYNELTVRGLYNWDQAMPDWQPGNSLTIPPFRETLVQLCALRAILDVRPKNWEDIVKLFMANPEAYVNHIVSCADPKWWPVQQKFVEYRLDRV